MPPPVRLFHIALARPPARPPPGSPAEYGGTVSGHPLAPYDACVVLSFGGPEGPDEVLPFLRRVTAGRGIPDERLIEVGAHYALFGGVSPINAQNRALVAALASEFAGRGVDIPVVLANRNTPPFVEDVLAELSPGRILVLLTSAYRSYSSCRQYREDLARAAHGHDLVIDKIEAYGDQPAFRDTLARLAGEAIDAAGGVEHVLTVAHSIPLAMDDASGPPESGGNAYSTMLAEVTIDLGARLAERTGVARPTDLVFCSRSGPPNQPWLEPDVGDRIEELATTGIRRIALVPIGFVSDHMEVRYDLDVQPRERADAVDVATVRTPTVGTDPQFVAMLADLALARAAQARGEAPGCVSATACPTDCCRNLRADLPALCGR